MIATDNAGFAFDLYSQLKTRDGNLFFSPHSISTCLAMTYAGARGDTAKQIAKTFHFYADPVALSAPFGALQRQLNANASAEGLELNIVNGLWAEASQTFQPKFMDIAKTQYDARLEQVDFRTQSEPVRMDINDWVSTRTKGKIKDLIAPGAVTATTRLVLVNAIYFKNRWAIPFKNNRTVDAPFSIAGNQKVPARLMQLDAQFNYVETSQLQMLELPYRAAPSGTALSMVVILPKVATDLKAVEDMLNVANLNIWLSTARPEQVNVMLPKFNLTDQFSLNDTLARMGMPLAFSDKADFSGMDGARDLFISAVVHKAFVEVNEKGTEAAAATGLTMEALAMRQPPKITFRADHPFVFLIRDMESGSILFLGRLTNPTK